MEFYEKAINNLYKPEIKIDSFDLIFSAIDKKAMSFFKERNINSFELITEKILIADILFKKIDFPSFFYKSIFKDMPAKDFNVKYGLTINQKLTNKYCAASDTYYSVINLYNKPILYYLYISVEEISEIMKKELKNHSLL